MFMVNHLIGFGISPSGQINVTSSSAEWTGGTANFTFSGDDVAKNTTQSAIRTVTALSGDFLITATFQSLGGTLRFGVFDAAEVGTFAGTGSDNGGMVSMTKSYYLDAGNNLNYIGSTSDGGSAPSTIATGSVMTLARTGSTIVLEDDGGSYHTFTSGLTDNVHICIAGGGAAVDLDDMSWSYNI